MGFPDETTQESTPRRGRRAAEEPPAPRGKRSAEEPAVPRGKRSAEEPPVPRGKRSAEDPPAPRSKTWSPYDEGKRSRGPLWFAIGGVAALVLLGGGLFVMWNMDSPKPASSDAARRTSAPLPSGPQGKYGYAGSRETDSEPLTIKEVFPTKKIDVSGRSYVVTITTKDKKCGDAVLGDKLQKALKKAKCTQLLRASFRDKDGKVIGTVGVANLNSGRDSTKVAAAGSKSDYVKPLPGKDSVTKLLGQGSGGAQARTHGHYVVMYWIQKKDGTKPDKKGFKALYQAVDDITQATVFKALDERSLTGQPAG
ncbi:hypothetical protein [Nonomuraea sediminis]|uniref:hypothetical protein n=1 Tax=Nonomuraea sediminis TaxID=2835864 RepID=UPI001BDBB77C|nr:hypothetical protein [Nonomuraea sediminis]